MDFHEKYLKFKKESCKEGFYCPEEHKLIADIANTPLYLRRWFRENGGTM